MAEEDFDGEPVYKEVTLADGKKIGKWVQLNAIETFDENEKKIMIEQKSGKGTYKRDSNGNIILIQGTQYEIDNYPALYFEVKHENMYNNEGKLIHKKTVTLIKNKEQEIQGKQTVEIRFDLNEDGESIHTKEFRDDQFYCETWINRNEKGLAISNKNQYEDDYSIELNEYDANDNLIHSKLTYNDDDSNPKNKETWYTNDEHGNCILEKCATDGETIFYIYEITYENDKKNKVFTYKTE